MYEISFIHRVTKLLVDIMFYGGIAALVVLPFVMPWLVANFARSDLGWIEQTISLGSAGGCAVYILFQLKRMFKTLMGGDPFVPQNISCFRKCGVASFLISLIFFIRLIFVFTLWSVTIVVIFAILGLFSLTMKDVFKQAVYYKEENDWTV